MSNPVVLLRENAAERPTRWGWSSSAQGNAAAVPRSLQPSISSRWAALAGTVRQQFSRHRRALCTSQCCELKVSRAPEERCLFFPFFGHESQSWCHQAQSWPNGLFLRHTRSCVTIWVAPTCEEAIYYPPPPSFILKQLFKSVWEARWEGSSLVYLQKLCWVISVYLRA